MKDILSVFFKFQRESFPARMELFRQLAHCQHPKALFITCSDSRVIPELPTRREPGELFVTRNAGNIVPPNGPEPGGVSAAIKICGHSDCGAMTAVASGESFEEMPGARGWLQYADAAKAIAATKQHLSHANHLDALIHTNVLAQLRNLTTHPPVAQSQQNGILTLHASVYDIGPGSIDAVDETQGQFISRSEFPDVRASSPRFH